jgi:hypothetical protein
MMKKMLALMIVLGVMTALILPLLGAGAQYVGAKKCMMCHKGETRGNQYGKWLSSPHAKAFETLQGEEAKAVAKKMGVDDPSKSDKCLKCHVTGFGAPASALAEGFDATAEGVSCEFCHGAGSLYKSMSVMKALRDGTQDAGQVGFIKGDKETCLKCHNEQSPTYKPFDFDKRWSEIAHPLPKK